MASDEEHEVIRTLTSWGRRRRGIEAERDPMVLDALSKGLSVEAVHHFTGLGRSTIERIREKGAGDGTS